MNYTLEENDIIELRKESDPAVSRTLTIQRQLGEGGNCIAYKASDGEISFVLKECCPTDVFFRKPDKSICWKNAEAEAKAKDRMRTAFKAQLALQADNETVNTNAHLVDTLFTANNTLYTLTDWGNCTTYDNERDRSVQEVFTTARAVARAIKAYHDKGYLHLDIKPENIMIYPETRDMVRLIDFDSIISMDEVLTGNIVYSPSYAAPEQVQGKKEQIGRPTDIYSIGALIFRRLFGRIPAAMDRSVLARWDYSYIVIPSDKLSGKCKRLMTELFRKTLCASPASRFQTTDELIAFLDTLIVESDPTRRFLNTSCVDLTANFVGRKNTVREIKSLFDSGLDSVFLSGMGGIGKTELAKYYAKLAKDDYDTVCFGKYNGSLKELFADEDFISIENNSSSEEVGLAAVRGLVNDRTLLIIDNFDIEDDPYISKVFQLPCKKLFTSRIDHHDLYPHAGHIQVGELSRGQQILLFEKESGIFEDESMQHDEQAVKDILDTIEGYTLLIPLIAKQYKNGVLSLEELAQTIKDAGISGAADDKVRHFKDGTTLKGNIYAILKNVLLRDGFTEDEKYVMESLALIGGAYVRRGKLLEWIGKKHNKSLNELVERNWVQLDGIGPNAVFSLHSVIQELIINEFKPDINDFVWVRKLCDDFIDQWCDGDKKQCRNYRSGADAHLRSRSVYRNFGGRLWVFKDYEKNEVDKYVRLIDTILDNLSSDSEANSIFIVQTYAKRVKYDVCCALNYTLGGTKVLEDILAKTEATWMKWHISSILVFLYLRKLIGKTYEPRSSSTVSDIISKLRYHLNEIRPDCFEKEISAVCTEYYVRIVQQLLFVGNELSRGICYTDWPEVNESAADEYEKLGTECALLALGYSREVAQEVELVKRELKDFKECMSSNGYLRHQELLRSDPCEEMGFDGEDEIDCGKLSPEQLDSYRLYDEISAMLPECVSLGFYDEPIENGKEIVSDPQNQKRVKEILYKARNMVESHGRTLQSLDYEPLNTCLCMLECVTDNESEAILRYNDYLESFYGLLDPGRICNTLWEYGFTKYAKLFVKIYADSGVFRKRALSIDMSDSLSVNRETWRFYKTVIALANQVEEPELAKEFELKLAQLGDTGFGFKKE